MDNSHDLRWSRIFLKTYRIMGSNYIILYNITIYILLDHDLIFYVLFKYIYNMFVHTHTSSGSEAACDHDLNSCKVPHVVVRVGVWL